MQVAVIAHTRKQLGAGLDAFRSALVEEGVPDPLWYEVPKSKAAPEQARKAKEAGAELVLVWGGDGTVQRCIDTLAGSDVALGILPAGTANLLATALGIPLDLRGALDVALRGDGRRLDVGCVNGERFAVMAGVGFDAVVMAEADRTLKDRFGRLAYIASGVKAMRADRFRARVEIDGAVWHDGPAAAVLLGNLGTIGGGVVVFEHARPDDGRLEVGVACPEGIWGWLRVFTRVLLRQTSRSPSVRVTSGRSVDVDLQPSTSTSSTVATGTRPTTSGPASSPEPSRSACR